MRGKIAAILNVRELVITVGADDGVELGTVFKVLDEPRPIIHPDTQESLGTVQREKVRVRIVDVQPKFSTGRTFEQYRVNVGGNGIGLSAITGMIGNPPKWETRTRTLKYDDTGLQYAPLSEAKAIVKIGDEVESVPEPQVSDESSAGADSGQVK